MSDRPRVVAVSGDPGGAEALAPVIAALREEPLEVKCYSYRQAGARWNDYQLDHTPLPEDISISQCSALLVRNRAQLLLVSTSANGANLERRFTTAAVQQGVASLAVLDFWGHYRLRFGNDQGFLEHLPDRIAVPDDRARGQMIADGFEPARVIVTGQPAFEQVVVWRERQDFAAITRKIRGHYGIAKDEWLFVFASQPISKFLGDEFSADGHPGFTERTVLPGVISVLERLPESQRITLVIRPHPREKEADYSEWSSPRVRIIVSAREDRRELALAADAVVGMNSAYLVETALLGCPTFCFQPGLKSPDALPEVATDFIRRTGNVLELEQILAAFMKAATPGGRPMGWTDEVSLFVGATRKIVALIQEAVNDLPIRM